MRVGLGRLVAMLLAALACAVGVSACGDDDGGGGGGGAEPATLKVGVIPIADVAPLYLGMKKGFFEEERYQVIADLVEKYGLAENVEVTELIGQR